MVLEKNDGWENVVTGLGIRGQDKGTAAVVSSIRMSHEDLECFYESDDMASKIVDLVPDEMTREGYKIIIENDDSGIGESILNTIEKLGIDERIEEALKWSRLYGGAGLILGEFNSDPESPIDARSFKGIEYAVTVDSTSLIIEAQNIEINPTMPNFRDAEFYMHQSLNGNKTVGNKIHHSRVVPFYGKKLPPKMRINFENWGSSILNKLFIPIRNYNTSHDSSAVIITDFTQGVMKMKHLNEMLKDECGEAAVKKRINLLAYASSIINMIVINEDEDFERKTTNVSGLTDLIRTATNRLVAATKIPHTILLNESASGLGATGQSERSNFYDYIKTQQESILLPAIRKIVELIMVSPDSPTAGKVVDFSVKFNQLSQPSAVEELDMRKKQSEIDSAYISQGVLDPDEVASSRFKNGDFSYDTFVDLENRNELDDGPDTQKEIDDLKEMMKKISKGA